MLPSKGYFKSLNCPYFDNGFCDRPHCHFRHTKREKLEEESEENDEATHLNDDINSILSDTNDGDSLPDKRQDEGTGVLIDTSVSYKPTPIAELKKRHIPITSMPSMSLSIPQKRRLEYDVKEIKKPKVEYIPGTKKASHVDYNSQLDCSSGSGSGKSHSLLSNSNVYKATKIPNNSDLKHTSFNNMSFLKSTEESDDEIDFDQVSNELNLLDKILKEYETKPENKEENVLNKGLDPNSHGNFSSSKETNKVILTSIEVTNGSIVKSPSNKENKCIFSEDNQIRVNKKRIETDKKINTTHTSVPENKKLEDNVNSSIQLQEKNSKYKTSALSNTKSEHKNSSNQKKQKFIDDNQKSNDDKSEKKADSKSIHSSRDKKLSKENGENEVKLNAHNVLKKEQNLNDNKSSNKEHKVIEDSCKKLSKNHLESRPNKSQKNESVQGCNYSKHFSSLKREKSTSIKSSKHQSDDETASKKRKLSMAENDSITSKNKKKLKSEDIHRRSSDDVNGKVSSKPHKYIKPTKESTASDKIKYKDKRKSSSSREHREQKQNHERSRERKDDHSKKTKCGSDTDDEVEIISDSESVIVVPDSEDETNSKHGDENRKEPARRRSDSSSSDQSRTLCSDDVYETNDESNEDAQPSSSTTVTNSQHQDNASMLDHRLKFNIKNRVSLGNAWRPPQRKAVEILTPAKRLLMFKKQMLESDPEEQPASGRVRIGCVPNVKLLLEEKERLLKMSSGKMPHSPHTVGRGDRNHLNKSLKNGSENSSIISFSRLDSAHKTSTEDEDKPPMVVKELCSRNTAGADIYTRQQYVDALYQATRQLVEPGESYSCAREKCLSLEKSVWINSKKDDYIQEMKKVINKTRIEVQSFTLKYYKYLKPRRAIMFPPELRPSKPDLKKLSLEESCKGISLYTALMPHLLKEEDLFNEGYPRKKEDPNRNDLAYISQESIDRWRKPKARPPTGYYECAKCKKFFQVDEKGYSIDTKGCNYHMKKSKTYTRSQGSCKVTHTCCGQTPENPCITSEYHAPDLLNYQHLEGFVETQEPEGPQPEEGWGILAVDCEMYWSTKGLELGRVTVVNAEQRVVYDTCVRPTNPVADYCTRTSGLTKENLENSNVTFADVQKVMLELVNNKTILIGHSLENDLKVLKIVHNTVIDTAVTFLNQNKKVALKALAKDKLNEVIQCEDEGHDSAEDAITCLKIMKQRVFKEAAQENKPKPPVTKMRYRKPRDLGLS